MQYLIKSGMQMDTFFQDVENKHDTSRKNEKKPFCENGKGFHQLQ